MIISDEIKKRAQIIGLDLTKYKNDEITSGYIHFEETNYKYEENSKSEAYNKGYHIETKFSGFNKGV